MLRTLAETAAGIGALATLSMTANLLALRGLDPRDVPGCVRVRVEWWSANVGTVLLVSAALTLLGLAGIAATATL
ncbi:hypothetical protein GCM10022251_53380 [Phytohabitans flavus]|nr:hypothetical protein [Phytohabitans flavus]